MAYYCYCGDVLMIYALSGLLFGLLIPYMSRRFAKFMPATLAYALYRIVKPVRRVSAAKRHLSATAVRTKHACWQRIFRLQWEYPKRLICYTRLMRCCCREIPRAFFPLSQQPIKRIKQSFPTWHCLYRSRCLCCLRFSWASGQFGCLYRRRRLSGCLR